MSENKYQQSPADDEQVERVARAISGAAQEHDGDYVRPLEDRHAHTIAHYKACARAAIAAMGGKRWGIEATHAKTGKKGWTAIAMGVMSSTDEALCRSVAVKLNTDALHRLDFTYKVREYVEQVRGKTADEIIDEAVAVFNLPEPMRVAAKCKLHLAVQAAAIENARKGADCGNP
jgi:hypothetical protein